MRMKTYPSHGTSFFLKFRLPLIFILPKQTVSPSLEV